VAQQLLQTLGIVEGLEEGVKSCNHAIE
jgi:hypothetical protein